jgi:Family of unknown function (DUF5677)
MNNEISVNYKISYDEISSKAEILKSFFAYFSEESVKSINGHTKDAKFFSLPLIILISHTFFGALASYNGKSFTNVTFSSRHLFECLLICKEISNDISAAERWYNFGKYQNLKLIIDNPSFYENEKLKSAGKEIKNKYQDIVKYIDKNVRRKDCWNLDKLNIYERANKLGLEKEYKILYKESCFISHPSSSFEIYTRNGLDDLYYQLMSRLRNCIIFSTCAIHEINSVYNVELKYDNLTSIIKDVGVIISKIDGIE